MHVHKQDPNLYVIGTGGLILYSDGEKDTIGTRIKVTCSNNDSTTHLCVNSGDAGRGIHL
jgi:hypothetical protein